MLSSPFPIEYLGELIEKFEAGVNYPPISENEPASEWRVLKISAVTWGEFNSKESKPIKPNTVFADSLIVRKGDLVISRANTTELVGAVALVRNTPPKVLLSDKLWRIKLSENSRLLPEYALLALRQPEVRRIIEELATGSSGSMQNISMEKAATIPIPLPPIAEQKRIAAIAQKCDRLRRTRRYTQQLSDSYLRSVFLEMFGDPVTNSKGWGISLIEEHITLVSSGSTPLGGSSVYLDEGIRFIRSQNVLMNKFDFSDVAYISQSTHEAMKRTWVKQNDVLLNITGASIGRVACYLDSKIANVNQHVCIIRLNGKFLNPIFLSFLLSIPQFQRKILSEQSGATRQAFTFDQIKEFSVILPPLALQEKFAQIVQRFERLRAQQREADRQAEHLFQTVLHRAFRGEL